MSLRTVELFCGAGGLATGFAQACSELGGRWESQAAVDQDVGALEVYRLNHGTKLISSSSVSALVDFQVRGARHGAEFVYTPEVTDPRWNRLQGSVDVVLAGPPCQGHSNLNNHSRRSDPRNRLYLTVPAAAVALDARVIVIENVPAVVHDRSGVVQTAETLLRSAGYHLTAGTIHAHRMGWPQRRARYFIVARRDREPLALDAVAELLRGEPRSTLWAIDGLEDAAGDDVMLQPAELSEENVRRIDWLFDNDAHDLDLAERPDCHRDGTSYMAVYGRLHADKPAPTITTGFMSPGQGRYVHPTRRRGLMPREAARLQGFPDTYQFQLPGGDPPARKSLAKWIGDAVPMPLGYAAGLSALGAGW